MGAPSHISLADDESPRARRRIRVAHDVERFLNHLTVRLLLSVAIIVSLMPTDWGVAPQLLFLAIFGTEFVARLFALVVTWRSAYDIVRPDDVRIEDAPRSRAGAVSLLLIDFVALVSFVPLPVAAGGARFLRLFRLTRMVLLAGYWAPLVRDVWAILSRRERMRQIVLMGFVVAGLSFAGAVFLHYVGGHDIDANVDGKIDEDDSQFWVMLWWAFRQVQDPGNIVESPRAAPILITSAALTVFGLFLVSFLIGLGTDVVRELLERMQLRPPGLRGHTVIINITPSTRRLLHELMRYYKKLLPTDARLFSARWFSDLQRRGVFGNKYLVVGRGDEPPDFLRQPELSRIVYREQAEEDEMQIARADLLRAKRILLLADPDEESPDAATIKTLLTFVERIAERERTQPEVARLERQRVVIAEILDESNVAAARSAVRTGDGSFRAFVVPTERLLALFIAGVVRRPGLGRLLEELLTSRGHELYTCFFQTEGLGFSLPRMPELGHDYQGVMRSLLASGLSRGNGGEATIVPLGLLAKADGPFGSQDFEVAVNPAGQHVDADVIGFIAIADGFASISSFAADIAEGKLPTDVPPCRTAIPDFRPSSRSEIRKALVCGFRPGSLYMLEELLRGQDGGEVLVVVQSEEQAAAADAALESHTDLVRRNLMPARHGVFESGPDRSYRFSLPDDPHHNTSTIYLRVADWMESRYLVDLPHERFGHVRELDAIVFVAEEGGHGDAKTTATLLKLEALFAEEGIPHGRPRVVAEVFDSRLAERLEAHCHTVGHHHVRIYSSQALRAFFLFQSVVVPGFDRVYSELLGSWGQSFVRFKPATPCSGPCTFYELGIELGARGILLIAVDVIDETGERVLSVAPAEGEVGRAFDLADLRTIWAIAPDRITDAPPITVAPDPTPAPEAHATAP